MARARQTVERRELGLMLRRLRTQAGKSQAQAAEVIGKVLSRVGDLEEGYSGITEENLIGLLDFYEVADSDRSLALELGEQARKRTPRLKNKSLMPPEFQRFTEFELNATEIRCHESGVIPGLLQSPGYIRALFHEARILWPAEGAHLEQRVTFRLDRQKRVLNSSTLESARFIVSEEALRGVPGGGGIAKEQLQHLLSLASANEHVAVQVLTKGSANPCRGTGFTVFGFGNASSVGFQATVFAPSPYHSDQDDVSRMIRVFDFLTGSALNEDDSFGFIQHLLKELK